ncbi:uncharacterized protein BDV17DRAFT_266113 [Aspergillus undulatus]|uniref:uncharacterized protein n=1 Tax=Aspergillus undulatus TaxID=1810928 RepID=UPI003CCCE9CB
MFPSGRRFLERIEQKRLRMFSQDNTQLTSPGSCRPTDSTSLSPTNSFFGSCQMARGRFSSAYFHITEQKSEPNTTASTTTTTSSLSTVTFDVPRATTDGGPPTPSTTPSESEFESESGSGSDPAVKNTTCRESGSASVSHY